MTSPHALTITLLVMTTAAVRGLPTTMMWKEEEADATTLNIVTEGSFLQAKSSEDVPSPDEENVKDKQQEECNDIETTSPPEVKLEEWQQKEVLDTLEDMTNNDSELTLSIDDMDKPIVNITDEQIVKLLPYYRALFNRPLELPLPSSESRARRATQQRICPADPVITRPQLGINGNGGVVQIVQLNAMNLTQVFFEEKCLYETSPISAASCVQGSRYVTAFVIDLQTFQFGEQTIEIQSCVSVLYI